MPQIAEDLPYVEIPQSMSLVEAHLRCVWEERHSATSSAFSPVNSPISAPRPPRIRRIIPPNYYDEIRIHSQSAWLILHRYCFVYLYLSAPRDGRLRWA